MLEKTLGSPLDCKEIQPVHSKGNQSWVFTARTDVEAETPILWPPDVKSWLIGKDPDAGKDWGQEETGTTEDEMVGWHHRLYGHGFGWTPGVGDGQGGLVCCGSWGRKESDTTERLNWTELMVGSRGKSSSPLPKRQPIALASFVEKTVIFPTVNGAFEVNSLLIYMWVYFWTLYSVPLHLSLYQQPWYDLEITVLKLKHWMEARSIISTPFNSVLIPRGRTF